MRLPGRAVARIPRGVWTLGLVSMAMDVSSEMIHSLLPVYLVVVMGVPTAAVGLLEGVAEATASITKAFSGALSDRLGKRKWLAAAGYGMAALTKPIFPVANSFAWVVVARFLDRVGKGIRGAPRDALVADITPPGLRGAAFGLRQSLDTIGAILGPLLAILFMGLTADNYRAVFWIAVLPAFLSFGLIALFVSEPDRPADLPVIRRPLSLREMRRLGRRYWAVAAVATIFTLGRFSEAFLILRAQSVGLPVALVPAVLIVMNAVYTLSAYPAGAFSDRIGRNRMLMAGFATLIAADLVLAFGGSLAAVAAGVALWGLHMGLTQGLLASLVADTAPPDLRGTAFGMYSLLTGVALLAASALAGVLWQAVSPEATFLAGAAFAGAALLLLPLLRRQVPGGGGAS